jgi:hypothetical protein
MADKKISALTAATTPLAGTEVLPIVQSGSTVKVAVSDLTTGRAVSGLSFSAGTNIGLQNTSATAYSGLALNSNDPNASTRNWAIATTYNDYGDMCFVQSATIGASPVGGTVRGEFSNTNGNFKVNTGNLVIGTAGKGIDFSANRPELAAYTKGSVIKRTFNPSGVNAYVSYVELRDFAVVLNHPSASVTTTEIQIGIDLRNITRSLVNNVWVGNDAPTNQTVYVKASPSGGYGSQGYGIVCGNVSSGNPEYAGGEVNRIVGCNVVGAYKNIVLDDAVLSPLSSVHSTSVERCDLQGGQMLLVQEQQYTAGTYFFGNTIQNVQNQPGNANPSFVLRMDGYNGYSREAYIEAGADVDYILFLGADSKNNQVYMTYYTSVSGTGFISDDGDNNYISYFENTSVAPAVDSLGAPIYLYDNTYTLPYRNVWVKFHWDGSAVVVDGSSGNVSVSRTGTGDYTVTYPKAFPSTNYAIAATLDTNVSGHGGLWSILSHTTTNLRIATQAQNGGTTTSIDPRYVWVQVSV